MKQLLLLASILFSINLTAQSTFVTGFDGGLHTGGNTIEETVDFPADVSGFSQILMNVSLDCPTGGCDPWDRFASLKVKVGGEEIEIGRYVTPYGNDWCDWTIDVTEYRNYLEGTQTLKSSIETWQNGWLVNTEFEFVPGTPDFEYVHVQNLWVDYNFTYGDTLFYSIDLDAKDVMVPSNAEEVIVRIVNTGHGQGNTDNAAEFSQRTHAVHINGTEEFSQFLWKDDCDQNPCSPQGGTWQFNRAGWCPGEHVTPDDFDITTMTTAGQMVNIDYVLEPFFNLCSPWNPSCDEPTTCSECTYNSSTHTEPHYKIVGQVMFKANEPLDVVGVNEPGSGLQVSIYPNPSTGTVFMQLPAADAYQVMVTDLGGRTILNHAFNGNATELDLNNQPAGLYLIRIQGQNSSVVQRIIIE